MELIGACGGSGMQHRHGGGPGGLPAAVAVHACGSGSSGWRQAAAAAAARVRWRRPLPVGRAVRGGKQPGLLSDPSSPGGPGRPYRPCSACEGEQRGRFAEGTSGSHKTAPAPPALRNRNPCPRGPAPRSADAPPAWETIFSNGPDKPEGKPGILKGRPRPSPGVPGPCPCSPQQRLAGLLRGGPHESYPPPALRNRIPCFRRPASRSDDLLPAVGRE